MSYEFLIQKAKEEKEAAENKIRAAIESVPEKYRGFITFLNKSVKLGKVNNSKDLPAELKQLGAWLNKDGTVYLTVSQPYMTVDGRVLWARDQHREAGKKLDMSTKICDGYVRAIIKSEIYGIATAIATIGNGEGSAVDKTNALENAETSAIGRALGFLGYGILGTGIASAEEVIDAQKKLAQLEESQNKTQNKSQSKAQNKENKQEEQNFLWIKGKISDITPARGKDGVIYGIKLDTGETVVIAEAHPFMTVIDAYKERILEFRCQRSPKGHNYLVPGFGNVKADGQVVA